MCVRVLQSGAFAAMICACRRGIVRHPPLVPLRALSVRTVKTVGYYKSKPVIRATEAPPGDIASRMVGQRNGPDSAAVVARIAAEYEENFVLLTFC